MIDCNELNKGLYIYIYICAKYLCRESCALKKKKERERERERERRLPLVWHAVATPCTSAASKRARKNFQCEAQQ